MYNELRKKHLESKYSMRDICKKTSMKLIRFSNMLNDRCFDATREEVTMLETFFDADLQYLLDEEYRKNAKKQFDKDMRQAEVTAKVIHRIKKKHGMMNASGKIECPLCGGDVLYSVSAINGHTMGKCVNECVGWME